MLQKGRELKRTLCRSKASESSSPPLRHDQLLKTHTPRSGLGLRPSRSRWETSQAPLPRRARRHLRHSPGLGSRVARGRLLLARGTDAHLPTPRRWLHQERWRIQAALADMAHEGLTGAVVPRYPLGHAPTEGGGERLREGRHRRGGPPARAGAGVARWGSAVPAKPPTMPKDAMLIYHLLLAGTKPGSGLRRAASVSLPVTLPGG